jgi:TetR/AcrR family transcriptional regulator
MGEKEKQTEQHILDAAKKVFYAKGYAGARMQEIADEAKINKAMLHYYFRSKEKLFDRIFAESFQNLFPKIMQIFIDDLTFEQKVESFFDKYIDFLLSNPHLPGFVLHELTHNPKGLSEMFDKSLPMPRKDLLKNVFDMPEGYMQGLDERQLFTNLLSWAIFPFVARPILSEVYDLDDKDFHAFVEERKKLLPKLFLNSLKEK